jgi:regulator of sigma E protease
MLFGWIGLILGFSGLIFVHEFGHFILAKWNGVRVYVFSLGMGPYLASFTWRGTIYALSLVPIGGYVKLQGQDDLDPNPKPTKDPHDYRNKKPGQKAAILAAGAIFNLLFAVFLFTICYSVGVEMEPPRLGMIVPGKPLANAMLVKDGTTPANLKEGDRIREVNGVPVKSALEAMLQIAGTPQNSDLHLRLDRRGGQPDDQYVTVKTERDKKIGASGIGLNPYFFEMKLPLGFTTTDYIVVKRDPASIEKLKDMPAAKAGLQKGDIIVQVGDRPIQKLEDMLLAGPRSEGKQTKFIIKRDGKLIEKELTPEKKEENENNWMFGIEPEVVRKVSQIDPNSEAYRNGLRSDGDSGPGHYVFGFMPDSEEWEGDNPFTLVWKTGKLHYASTWDAKPNDIQTLDLSVPPAGSSDLVFTQERQAVEKYKAPGGIGDAVSVAWSDTIRFSGSVFTVLQGLFTRDVSVQALSGPIGIGTVMVKVAGTQTLMRFLWLLAFISLNLGVLQFVPIPLLDGWHLLMVLVEKMKGSPVAPRVQEAFQYVGIFIVGALLLLATYNDIYRFFVH